MLKKAQNQLINFNKLGNAVQPYRAYAKMLGDADVKDKLGSRQSNVNFQSKTLHQLKESPLRPISKPTITKVNKLPLHDPHQAFDDTLGTWDDTLGTGNMDFGILFSKSVEKGLPIPKITVENAGSSTLLGRRCTNEDRIRIKELMPNLLYFAIFDGHAGSLCAQFCQNYMEDFILYCLRNGERDLREVLEKSFIDINNVFAHFLTVNRVDKSEENSGTTATVCLLRNSIELVVAHVGDSRAILCRDGKAKRLTIDHTGELKSEKERILKSGGRIEKDNLGRCMVNGRLAMTRSIGDYDLKPFGVTAVPDTKEIEIKHGKDAFLILTTDGINYVMNDEEIVAAVNSCGTTVEAAQSVCEQAMVYSSEDNASSLVVQFGSWNKFSSLSNNSNNLFNFGRQLNMSSRF